MTTINRIRNPRVGASKTQRSVRLPSVESRGKFLRPKVDEMLKETPENLSKEAMSTFTMLGPMNCFSFEEES